MGLSITAADAYIQENVIDIEDWVEADEAKKQRILKVANSTLSRKFNQYIIPDNAVYDFSAVLAIIYNDTNKLNIQGISGFSISGVASFNFKGSSSKEISSSVPQTTLDLISEANGGVKIAKTRIARSIR